MHQSGKWLDAINVAPNARALEDIMRAYVTAIAPSLEGLPEDCRVDLAHPLDIQAAAVAMMRAELSLRRAPEEHAVLHQVALTFAAASVRMAQLHSVTLPHGTPRPGAATDGTDRGLL